MKKQVELDQITSQAAPKWEIIKTPANRKRSIIAFVLMWNNQFTGILMVATYGVYLYENLGLSGYKPLLLSALWVAISFPCNLACAFFVERFGRRRFFIIGLSGCLVCLILEAALQARYLGSNNHAGLDAAIFFIFLFVAPFYAMFLDPTQWLYIAEIFPTHIRSQGMAIGTIGFYFADTIVLAVGPTALNNIGWKFFFVFIIPTFFHLIFVYFVLPETKGRTLEDINAQFGDNVAVHYYHATKEEQAELDRAAQEDEYQELRGRAVDEKVHESKSVEVETVIA